MQVKFKSIVFAVSLLINAAFALLLAAAPFQSVSHISFHAPGGYIAAAAVAAAPPGGSVSFGTVEINLRPGETAFLQFSVSSGGRQGNLLINALYDRSVISVSHTGHGIEITALAGGSTLMQALASDGIKDVALVTVGE